MSRPTMMHVIKTDSRAPKTTTGQTGNSYKYIQCMWLQLITDYNNRGRTQTAVDEVNATADLDLHVPFDLERGERASV